MEELQQRRGPGRPPNPTVAPTTNSTQEVRQRPARKPFGTLEQKLAYPARPGFHRHWFNDAGNNVARAIEAGYTHVTGNDEGKNVSKLVGTAEGGGPLIAFLMETPQEWHDEDMKEQQAQIDAKENSMRRGELESKEGDGRYVPQQGIRIKHGS